MSFPILSTTTPVFPSLSSQLPISSDCSDSISQPKLSPQFELQKRLTLPEGTIQIEIDMLEEGCVVQAADNPFYLYTDYLGPCIAAVVRCKELRGLTHLFPDKKDYHEDLWKIPIPNLITLNKEKILLNKEFISNKLFQLVNKFILHPSYQGEKIEIFFAGGNGNAYDGFWRELVVEYAKSIEQVEVIGTYFNPFESTPEIEMAILRDQLKFSLQAGITHQGSILLCKSHDVTFQFQLDAYNSYLDLQSRM